MNTLLGCFVPILSTDAKACNESSVQSIDGIQNYKIVIATLFRHFEWGKYQKFPLRYVEIQ